ncbi:MAG: patatin-like phospholipase family protein [Sandaracinaceae bacterium]
MKLVLEGGGSRAAFSAGVLLALERAEIPCEAVVGSSTSAVNAAYFAAHQMDVCVRMWTEVVPDDFISYARLFVPGRPAIDVDRMIDDVLGGGWSKLDVDTALSGDPTLYVAATEVPSGTPHVVRPDRARLFEWLRASTALPVGYNRTVRVGEREYVDSGLSAPVPYDWPLETEWDAPTVVVLTRRPDTLKSQPSWWQRAFLSMIVPPAIRAASMAQHELYNELIGKLMAERDPKKLIVLGPPDDMPLSRLTRDVASLQRGVDVGIREGERLAKEIAGR